MDLRKFLLDNASLQSWPKRRRHSIADVRFLHTLNDIPESPEEEEKERRRSTGGSFQKEERSRSVSEPPCDISTERCNEDAVSLSRNARNAGEPMDSRKLPMSHVSIDDLGDENSRNFKRSPSEIDEEQVIEAVSTYVLSYTDDAGNVIGADEISPSTTGSSSPQDSSKETSDEELALSEMLRKMETPMATSRSRRGSVIDEHVVERITSMTPIVESSRSSSCASVVVNLKSFEPSPDNSDENQGSDHGSRGSSLRNVDNKHDMLGKILVSPRLTRRGSLSDVLNTLSPQFNSSADPSRQDTKKRQSSQIQDEGKVQRKVEGTDKLTKQQGTSNSGMLKSTHLSAQMYGQIKDPWRPLSPLNIKTEANEHPKLHENGRNYSPEKENGSVINKIMNSPTLLKRRGSLGDVLRSLSPNVGNPPPQCRPVFPSSVKTERDEHWKLQENVKKDCSKKENGHALDNIMNSPTLPNRRSSLGVAVEKAGGGDSPNKDKGILGRIINSPCLTRRGSIGNVLSCLSPSPDKKRTSSSPSPAKSHAKEDSSKMKAAVCVGGSEPKDVGKSSGASGPKGLLAIVQRQVMNHCQTLQSKRRNSIASTKPYTGTLEMSLRDSLDTGGRGIENKPVVDCKSPVIKASVAAATKDSLSRKKSTQSSSNNDINSDKKGQRIDTKTSNSEDVSRSSVKQTAPSLHNGDEDTTSDSTDNSRPKDMSQTSVNHDVISPTPNRLLESESMDVPCTQLDVTLPQRKTSAPLPPKTIDAPQRKSSVNIIKRSPVTFVISNDRTGKNEVKGNGLGYQAPSGVSFMNSRFLPLGQEEAEEYSKLKQEETCKSSVDTALNSTITMSSRVTVYGGNGIIVRKQGTAAKQPPLNDSLPTDERFAALSERYASLKAKIGGNDANQKIQNFSQKAAESSDRSPNKEDTSAMSKCWTTAESIPVEEFKDNVYDKRFEVLYPECGRAPTVANDDKQKGSSEESDSDVSGMRNIRSEKNDARRNDAGNVKTVCSIYGNEKDVNIDGDITTTDNKTSNKNNKNSDENNNKPNMAEIGDGKGGIRTSEKIALDSVANIYDTGNDFDINRDITSSNTLPNTNKPSTAEIDDKKGENRTKNKTALDLRPESPAPRTRTSVVAKLMNRKIGARRKQSIVPRVAKRRSKVYKENCSGDSGIPASAAQFEKIRAFVENTVLRAPVRQEALTIQELLNGLSSCLTETELVAICKECSKTLRTLDALGSLPSYVSLESVIINPSGTIKFKHLSTGISIDNLYLAPEYSNRFASEKTCVFSLAATLWSAADWRLTEAEKPSLSPRFQELLVSMTDDSPDARPGLYDVLQTCESLQTVRDMTSRERCQALLWEYQASAVMDNEDATKRKTLQEEKKHHDTLMGSISVAASFKGFLKQTAKPQERNPFVKAQKNQEQPNKIDCKPAEKMSANRTVLNSVELETEKDTAVENEQKLKDSSSKSEERKKEIHSSDSINDTSPSVRDVNNNKKLGTERKRGYSLTEEQKEQLLSLLASAKLNKNSLETATNERKSEEPSNQTTKAVEEHPVKPPSPSLYAYPQYAQTESQMMFSPITPAGRSVSPSVHSDVSNSQIPAVPNFMPIAVPIPSVAPVPMPPFWYMPQGGMMPYPQPAMSPVQYVPTDPSVASNQSVVSTDSDVSEMSDQDIRSNRTRSAIPRRDKSENSGPVSEKDTEQKTRMESKGSKLPRPIWQKPVTKSRETPVESEANSIVVRRRTPISDACNERNDDIKPKPVRARTPSPSLGRRSSPKVTTPPRSQTPPVYWTRDGVEIPANNKPQKRASVGSFPNRRPSSPSNSPDGRRRSSSSPSRSRSNSPVERPRRSSSGSRPPSPAGSRSNSPVAMLVSKFEQLSQESSGNSPRVRSNSVSSMISKFGSSSLVPEDRMVKGQFKPNLSASAPQPTDKTGPFRPSTARDRAQAVSNHALSGNPISLRDRNRASESLDDDKRSLITNSVDPREVQRSGSDPGSNDNRRERLSGESRCRLSSSLGNIHKASECNAETYQDSTTRLLENIRKWSSQENIMQDSSSDALVKSIRERLMTELSLNDDYSTKKEKELSTNAKPERSPSGKSSCSTPSRERSSSSSSDLRNEFIIQSSSALDSLSKPWQTKDCLSTDLTRKSPLDSEPVRGKGSPKSRPRDMCITSERGSSNQYCDITSPKGFLWSPTSDTHKFEIPVALESTTPTVSSPLRSVCGFDESYGGRDRSTLSSSAPLSPGSLKDFKPSNYFTSVTFKCGEMEPERDTNCLIKSRSRDNKDVSSNSVTNRRDLNVNYVRRFERKILRSTGDVEDELFRSNSGYGGVQNVTSKDANAVDSVGGNPKSETKENSRPVTSTPGKNTPISARQELSAATKSSIDSKNSSNSSRTDAILRSRLPSGDGSSLSDRTSASTSRNPPSPMTIRKLLSNPLPQEKNTSSTRPSTSKRNSLPNSQAINLSPNRDPSNLPITKSSSQTNLSTNQEQVKKGSSETNLSARQIGGDVLPNYSSKRSALSQKKKNEPVGRTNPLSKLVSSNNSQAKGDETKTKSSAVNTNQGKANNPHASKEKQSSKTPSKERNPNSSNPHLQAAKTKSVTSDASRNSVSSTVRYPYTRRASTPVKGSSTIKPPPKAASNPASPLYPKQQKGTLEFFGASGTYPDNHQALMNPGDSDSDQLNIEQKGSQNNPKPKKRTQSSEASSAASSGLGSSPMASPARSFSKSSSSFVLPTRAQLLEQSSSSGDPVDSDVFYVPSSGEPLPKSEPTSAKATTKRFPSSSSSDSGLNMSDPDDTRKVNENGDKSSRVRSPPTSPTSLSPSHSPSPTSPKFPIGSNFFYDPRDQQSNLPLGGKGSSDGLKEPPNLRNLSSSFQQNDAPNLLNNSPGKSSESPKKTERSDSDKFKSLKSEVSKMQDKISLDANDQVNSLPEKEKNTTTALRAVVIPEIVKSSSQERLASSTPPPDIPVRPSSKSPPSSSRVDSKELLGQLVKKVLNSAAAKQGSSPKTSFAEPVSSATKDNGKGKRARQGKMFFLPEETIEVEEKDKSNRQRQSKSTGTSNPVQMLSDAEKASKKKEQRLSDSKDRTAARSREEITGNTSAQSLPAASNKAPITPKNASNTESTSSKEQSAEPKEKNALSKIIDLIHDEFAFDGYLDDGVEDVNMAEYVLSLAGMSEENFKEAITDQYSDLYWDEDLLHEMYEAVTGEQQTRRPILQFSESTLSDIIPPESINLSREESYLSLEPLYFNSISRSSSERSGTGARDILVSPLGEATEFLPIKVIAPEMQADIQELLTPIFEDSHKVMGIKLASGVKDLSDKLGTKIMEISQQLMLERRAKKKSMNSYNKMADVENKKDVKDLASKLVNEIEESDKKIIYLKNVQRQLRNVYAERFGIDTSLLYAFLVSYNRTCVTLEPELNNSFLNFSPMWNQRLNESIDIIDESLFGPSLQSGTKLGLFSYLFDRHAMSQSYVRYFLYTYRYITTPQELFTFIREKCSASLRTDLSGQVYNHQLQIRYRALDLLSEWIDGYYQFDFKTNPNLIKELLAFVKDELILVDRSERGHYLMELVSEKQKQDLNNNSLSEEITDFVAVLQLEDPQGLDPIEGKKDSLRKPSSSRKAKSPVQCFRRATPEKGTTYKQTLYLKALSVLDHSSRILAEQLTLIQQDFFVRIHPVHFLNSRAHGIGVGRSQSPTRERDNIFGFSTGSRRISELPGSDQGPLPWEQNMYVSMPSSDGALEDLLEHAQDVSLWVAVEICSASSVKAQLALITKFVNAARYCCEIRNYSTCIQIIDALEMFVVRHLPVWKQVPTKTTEVLEELKAVKVLLKTDSSWLMKSESSRDKPTIPCFLLFVIHVQQQELGGFTLPSDMYKWTKMRSVARLVDQIRLFKQMRYAFQTDEELKDRLKQRIHECKNENLHALASENASNFHLSSSHSSRKFHDAFRKMKATFGGHSE